MSSSPEPGPQLPAEPASEAVFEVAQDATQAPDRPLKRSAQPNDDEGEEVVNVLELEQDPSATTEDNPPADGEEQSTELTKTKKHKDKKKKKDKNKPRPARPQADLASMKDRPPQQTGTVFNIWYNKWSGGDREDKYAAKGKAEGRCNVARDSGYTKADKVPGSYFCIFFARGVCPLGKNCNYLHRLPTVTDMFDPSVDCFGRDKHADYRDDMDGVGSFQRQNRTIYIGRIFVSDDIEEVVARHFAEWGDIERIRVLNSRGVAFVTYVNEANAQFAKEAMSCQSLDHDEILNVRWASVDPNPLAKAREQRRVEEQAAEAVKKLLPPDFLEKLQREQSTALQPAKRRKY
ncbi:hypothetical protein BZA70DRAFT_272440 [Myxozyma melibiosi]|uniref:Pre-mRNA-splicing factor CWC2 n=1 Tax=Myxozyma melibiosi TaxID=54550 RepID=A0ABR1FDG2_9ASCO